MKRMFDLMVSLLALLVLSPLLLVVAVVVRLAHGRPVLFRQMRPGLHERPFHILKFRSMRDAVDARGQPLPDAQRLTPLGRWLRATSIDELPALWNVVRGDMSLVGPRPLLMSYLPRYNARQRRRHEVRPGITGLAQVHGRNTLAWQERFELDVWYVDHHTLWLDLRILALTVLLVLRRDGVNTPGHATADDFQGNPD